MAGARRIGARRVAGTGPAQEKAGARAAKAKKKRATGLKAVDTIPRLDRLELEDADSAGLDRFLGGEPGEGFSQTYFVNDLLRVLDFLETLPSEGRLPGGHPDLHLECMRIVKEEVERARELAAMRKGAPRA